MVFPSLYQCMQKYAEVYTFFGKIIQFYAKYTKFAKALKKYYKICQKNPIFLAKLCTKMYTRHCKNLQRSQSHSVELVFAPFLGKFSGLTLVPSQR